MEMKTTKRLMAIGALGILVLATYYGIDGAISMALGAVLGYIVRDLNSET